MSGLLVLAVLVLSLAPTDVKAHTRGNVPAAGVVSAVYHDSLEASTGSVRADRPCHGHPRIDGTNCCASVCCPFASGPLPSAEPFPAPAQSGLTRHDVALVPFPRGLSSAPIPPPPRRV